MGMRHWKQHWDPDAPLVFTKRLTLGIEGYAVVQPGDEVTPAMRAALGKTPAHATARLRRWWEARFLAIKDWKSPQQVQAERAAQPRPTLELQDVGRGRYLVFGATPGAEPHKAYGRKKADELLAKLKAEAAATTVA